MAELKTNLQIDYSKVKEAMNNVMEKYAAFEQSLEELKNAEITYTADVPVVEKSPWWKFWKN